MAILKQEPGIIQYKTTDNLNLSRFKYSFYVYNADTLSVYKTPAGNIANDSTQLLTYPTGYAGTSYPSPIVENGVTFFGYIDLTTPANVGDIITIFYDYGSATIIPRYPYCSTADREKDGLLPALNPGTLWVKSANEGIVTSNLTLSPTTINNQSYDDIAGVNNLLANGAITVDNINTTSIYIKDLESPNKTIEITSAFGGFTDNHTYYCPENIGNEGDVLTISVKNPDGNNSASLAWSPSTVQAWVRFFVRHDPPDAHPVVNITSKYNVSDVVRISQGLFDVLFVNEFSSGDSYSWQTTSFMSSTTVYSILQAAAYGYIGAAAPKPKSCTFVCWDSNQTAKDPFQDVCISFFGT